MSPRLPDLAGIAADADTMTEARIHFDTPEWKALMEWLRFHHIDPHLVLAGTRVSRHEVERCIRYVGIVVDKNGRKVVDPDDPEQRIVTAPMIEQGEAPPLPYPDLVAALLEPVRSSR